MRILEKVERRLGEKLFLKGDRCVSQKCAFSRRSYPPGIHGKKGKKGGGRKRGLSEMGKLLQEKQKVRFLYGLDDKNLERYYKDSIRKPGIFIINFLKLLEGRLDNVVLRMGLAESRHRARQFISHGHILVNGRKLNIPSYQVKIGDTIAIKEKSLSLPIFADLETKLKKHEIPSWLQLDPVKKTGKIVVRPETETFQSIFDVSKIKEFYSR